MFRSRFAGCERNVSLDEVVCGKMKRAWIYNWNLQNITLCLIYFSYCTNEFLFVLRRGLLFSLVKKLSIYQRRENLELD